MKPHAAFLTLVGIMALSRADAPSPQRVLLVGDSLAIGMSDEFRVLARHSGMDGRVEAKTGSRIDQWVRWLPAQLAHHRPSLVIVCLGTNDMMLADGTRRNPDLVTILTREVEQIHAKIMWVGPPKFPNGRLPYEQDIRAILQQKAPNLYDSRALDLPGGGDGVHLSPQGYKQWIDAIWRKLEESG